MRKNTDTSPIFDYTDKALTMSKNPCVEKSKRKRKSKNTEVPKTATASQKRIKSCKAVNNEDIAESNADNRRQTAIRFSSPLVTEQTESGEKGGNISNITDNNPPTQTKKFWKFRWAGRSVTEMKEIATKIPLKKKTATTSRYRTTTSR